MRFWSRKTEAKADLRKAVEPKVFSTSSVCHTCGCLIAIGRGKVVADGLQDCLVFYCESKACSPPYDQVRVVSLTGEVRYYRQEPARLVRVTEKGKPFKAEGK